MGFAKRLTAGIALATLLATTLITTPASAHVLQSNHGVSAILHLKPDDNPVAGKPIPVNFLFSNDAGGFSLNNYGVQLSLLQDGNVRVSTPVKPLFFGSATEGETIATFPTVGVYTVLATGKPTTAGQPEFTLNFTVRVADSVSSVKKGDGGTTALLSVFSLILLIMVAAKAIQSGGKYRK